MAGEKTGEGEKPDIELLEKTAGRVGEILEHLVDISSLGQEVQKLLTHYKKLAGELAQSKITYDKRDGEYTALQADHSKLQQEHNYNLQLLGTKENKIAEISQQNKDSEKKLKQDLEKATQDAFEALSKNTRFQNQLNELNESAGATNYLNLGLHDEIAKLREEKEGLSTQNLGYQKALAEGLKEIRKQIGGLDGKYREMLGTLIKIAEKYDAPEEAEIELTPVDEECREAGAIGAVEHAEKKSRKADTTNAVEYIAIKLCAESNLGTEEEKVNSFATSLTVELLEFCKGNGLGERAYDQLLQIPLADKVIMQHFAEKGEDGFAFAILLGCASYQSGKKQNNLDGVMGRAKRTYGIHVKSNPELDKIVAPENKMPDKA